MNSAADKLYETSQLNSYNFWTFQVVFQKFYFNFIPYNSRTGSCAIKLSVFGVLNWIGTFEEDKKDSQNTLYNFTWAGPRIIWLWGTDDELSLFYICANIYYYEHQSVYCLLFLYLRSKLDTIHKTACMNYFFINECHTEIGK